MSTTAPYKFGTPEYVHDHGISRMKRGKQPSAILVLGSTEIRNPKAAFYLAGLLLGDTETTLLGKPFLRSEIDWAEKFAEHLRGPNADISFSPTSGIDQCSCKLCFYRDAPPPLNPKRECQIVGKAPQQFFGFIGDAKNTFMPPTINGKDLGHYCPYWLSMDAE